MTRPERPTGFDWIDTLATFLVVGVVVGFALLVLDFVYLYTFTKEYPLPERTLRLPAPEILSDSAKAQTGAKGLVVYAKEPMSFNPPANRGFYYLYGYVLASQPLGAPVGVYVRAKDPSEDLACKVLPATLTVQNEVADSAVYVCEEGQNDLKAAVAKFMNTTFSSFCSLKESAQETYQVGATFSKGRFWIGIKWNPLLSYPLIFSFSNVIAYGPAPIGTPSFCAPIYRIRSQ
jgi:hypothetical protein